MVHIKDPLLLNGKSSHEVAAAGFLSHLVFILYKAKAIS